MSLNIFANVGTTSQSMTVTAVIATKMRITGYISDPDDLAARFARLANLLV